MSQAPISILTVLFGCALLSTGCLGSASDPKTGAGGDFDECPAGLIEDFEDGDAQIIAQDGRGGYWYPEADEDGTTITPDGEFEPCTS